MPFFGFKRIKIQNCMLMAQKQMDNDIYKIRKVFSFYSYKINCNRIYSATLHIYSFHAFISQMIKDNNKSFKKTLNL